MEVIRQKKGRPRIDRRQARRRRRHEERLQAECVDRYALYQEAVQDPEQDVQFLLSAWSDVYGADDHPRHLREDFCGTALLATHWVRQGDDRSADAVDLDPECLDWGREHNLSSLGEDAHRVRLHQADVRDELGEKADVRCAQNFSWQILHRRAELLEYFRLAREGLAEKGIFVLDMFGGSEAVEEMEEVREVSDDFDYVWEQITFHPVTGHTDCAIHFRFPDGSELHNAFEYSWRLYTPPEVRDLLMEAGFSDVRFYFEEFDDEGDGTGNFLPTEQGEACEGWLAYVVATP